MTSFLLLEVLSCCKVWIYQVVVNTKINFVRITTRYIQNLLILNLPGKLTNFEFTGSKYKICIFAITATRYKSKIYNMAILKTPCI